MPISTLLLSLLFLVAAVRTFAMSTKAQANKATVFVHWFRLGDLRLHDNPALAHSLEAAKKYRASTGAAPAFLPIFCFDPRIFGDQARSSLSDSLKCGPRRAQFVLESVADLRQNLEKQGSGLVVAHGKPEHVMDQLLTKISKNNNNSSDMQFLPHLTCQHEVAREEETVAAAVQKMLKRHHKNASLEKVWGSTMYHIDDLPYNKDLSNMPDTFTPFRNKVEKSCQIGRPLSAPSKSQVQLPTRDSPIYQAIAARTATENNDKDDNSKCSLTYMPTLQDLGYTPEQIALLHESDMHVQNKVAMKFVGGETSALARVKDYIWDKDLLKVYFDTRNGMLGADYSTKLAPWLAAGCLSPRYVAQECLSYESQRVANKSTYWVVFELLWRDFFKFFTVKHGTSIFFPGGTVGSDKEWKVFAKSLEAWKNGQTGYPLVDANMRELKATGFMSNRGRQNVCSFLALDLQQDWRFGAEYFETELLDYDVYSNWGNWCSGAGMTGGRLNRFNIVKQSKDYDQHGDYVRYWLPELKNVPNQFVHEPWKMSLLQQKEYGCMLGVDYPTPIIPPPKIPSKNNPNNKGRQKKRSGSASGNQKPNPNRGRGQKQDMKSLDAGRYQIKG